MHDIVHALLDLRSVFALIMTKVWRIYVGARSGGQTWWVEVAGPPVRAKLLDCTTRTNAWKLSYQNFVHVIEGVGRVGRWIGPVLMEGHTIVLCWKGHLLSLYRGRQRAVKFADALRWVRLNCDGLVVLARTRVFSDREKIFDSTISQRVFGMIWSVSSMFICSRPWNFTIMRLIIPS